MASSDEVLEVLGTLQVAFPAYKPQDAAAMVDLYTRKLARFPVASLRQAADQIIDREKFFPSISALIERANAAEINSRFAQKAMQVQADSDFLADQRQALEDKFHLQGELDEEEWLNLVRAFVLAGKNCAAAAVYDRLQRILADEPAMP